MYKKLLAFLLIILCVMSCFTIIGTSAAGNGKLVTEGNYKAVYYDDGTAMLFEASVDEAHIVVPKTVGGYLITEISEAYKNNNKIKSVTIPDTITGILGCAFENCKNLESVTIPDTVTKIGGSAFEGCTSLKSINIPDSVTVIDDDSFLMCNSLKEITIPESVVEIGNCAFADCINLATININKNPDLVIAGDAFKYSRWYDMQPDGVVYLDRFALGYKGYMPDDLKVEFREGTTAICNDMFYDAEFDEDVTALTGVTFPDTLTYIGDNAFKKCVNLNAIDFPEGLIHIGDYAFEGCKSLSNVIIPSQVKNLRHGFIRSGLESVTLKCNPEMWYSAFYECENLKEVNLPETIENIHSFAFYRCYALESITLPDSVKNIEGGAFKDCVNLKEINHSGKIYMVDTNSFSDTAWENAQPDGLFYFGNVLMGYKGNVPATSELNVKDGVKAIANSAFARNLNLTKITLPEGLVVIGPNAFRSTMIKEIDIPESVEFIGYFAFAGCEELSNAVIRGSGTIEYQAFINCMKFKNLTISANVTEIQDAAFGAYFGMATDPLYMEDFTVYGVADSEAEEYANKNNLIFVNTYKPVTGDVTRDGDVNIKDATAIQKHLAAINIFSSEVESLADYDGDGTITIKDATAIQKFIAGLA